jgi:hypothetical protein
MTFSLVPRQPECFGAKSFLRFKKFIQVAFIRKSQLTGNFIYPHITEAKTCLHQLTGKPPYYIYRFKFNSAAIH